MIEDDRGTRFGIEICFSVNSLLTQLHDVRHPILATPASAACAWGERSLMLADALGSAVALVREGLTPTARGRAGNLRSILKVVAERQHVLGLRDRRLLNLIARVAADDSTVYRHVSPASVGCPKPQGPTEITSQIAGYLARLG